jgi:adenylate cyclase class IV
VVILEHLITEVRYLLFRHKLLKKGFKSEKYYEARFFISANQNRENIIQDLSKKFNLKQRKVLNYTDIYFENNLPEFSSREPKLRIRHREGSIKSDDLKSVQVSYTRANEAQSEKFDQYRYFLVKKEKLYFPLDQKISKSFEEIKNNVVKKIISKFSNKKIFKIVKCRRELIEDDKVWIAFDEINKKNKHFMVEVKSFSKFKNYFQILRYIMREYPVIHTTYGKSEVFS